MCVYVKILMNAFLACVWHIEDEVVSHLYSGAKMNGHVIILLHCVKVNFIVAPNTQELLSKYYYVVCGKCVFPSTMMSITCTKQELYV